jgi:excisionase family DNA binding protein
VIPDSRPLAAAAVRLRKPPGRPRKAPQEAPGGAGLPDGVPPAVVAISPGGAGVPQANAPATGPVSMRVREAPVPVVCPPRLLDLAGAAAYLGLSGRTIRELIASGALPRVRIPCRPGARSVRSCWTARTSTAS